MKRKVLFVCIHNSARSQMAEEGIDISGKPTRSVFDLFRSSQLFSHVITVCDEASPERCPVWPGVTQRLHWSFPDPSKVTGGGEAKLELVRQIRDVIRTKIVEWRADICPEVAVGPLSTKF